MPARSAGSSCDGGDDAIEPEANLGLCPSFAEWGCRGAAGRRADTTGPTFWRGNFGTPAVLNRPGFFRNHESFVFDDQLVQAMFVPHQHMQLGLELGEFPANMRIAVGATVRFVVPPV